MKKLLEVLSSTGQRSSLEVLLRCEAVLEKMDLKGMVIFWKFFSTWKKVWVEILGIGLVFSKYANFEEGFFVKTNV